MENAIDESETDHSEVYKILKKVLEQCVQGGDAAELKDEFCDAFEKFQDQGFESNFKELLMTAFYKTGRSDEIRKLFNFISDCALKLDNEHKETNKDSNNPDDNERGQNMHPFLLNLFLHLRMWSKANSFVVRSHSHQLLTVLLNKLQEFGLEDLDVNIFEKIAEVVQRGRKDVCATVRAQAVLLAKFVQDPTVEDDLIINGLCWQLETDPHFRVRQNILEILAACEETILPVLERFLFDENEYVRNAGLLYICDRISPQSFRREQRCLIIHHCVFDNSKLVRKNGENRLIPVWFRAYGDKLTFFLRDLRLKGQHFEDLKFIKKLLTILIGSMTISQIIEDIELDRESCLLNTPLTAEKAFIWRTFCEIASQDEKYSKYLPTIENYSAFVEKYFQDLSADDEDHPYVCHELIKLHIHFQKKSSPEKWSHFGPIVFALIRNPYVSKIVVPVVINYLKRFTPDSEITAQEELVKLVMTFKRLYQVVPPEHSSKIMLKCITIVSEMLDQGVVISISDEIRSVKEDIILPLIESNNKEVKDEAIRALALYCFLDLEEAKLSWSTFLHSLNSDVPCCATLKSVFDILLHYGPEYFSNPSSDCEKVFEEIVNKLILVFDKGQKEEQIVLTEGILKLYLLNRMKSPTPLSKVMLLTYLPESPPAIKTTFCQFLTLWKKLKLDVQLLIKAFLEVLNSLFHSTKTSPLYKICIKTVVTSLVDFAKVHISKKEYYSVEKGEFMDMICLEVTKDFLQKPKRLPPADLQNILSHLTLTKNSSLIEIKRNINLIIKQLQAPTTGRKNSFHTKKFFVNFLKKIPTLSDSFENSEEAISGYASEQQLDCDADVEIQSVSSKDKVLSHTIASHVDDDQLSHGDNIMSPHAEDNISSNDDNIASSNVNNIASSRVGDNIASSHVDHIASSHMGKNIAPSLVDGNIVSSLVDDDKASSLFDSDKSSSPINDDKISSYINDDMAVDVINESSDLE